MARTSTTKPPAGDTLATYRAKRDFEKTAEPPGATRPTSGNGFLVQKHDATRVHYDFRLELDGVLLSWAVTRGPSNDPEDKRLAVRTEDHPLDYATFEGTIPKGQYGGGTVMLWDNGTWESLPGKDPSKTIPEGHLHFFLHGHPNETIYTFWDYFRNAYARNAGLRLDHLLLNATAADRLEAAGVNRHVRGWEKTSDHAPTWIELGAKSKRRRKAS